MAPDLVPATEADHNLLPASPRIVAIANQKGGVGKTTTAINLGSALADLGHPVLLIDLDPQANTTSGLGLDPKRQRLTVYDLLAGDAAVDDIARPTPVGGLHLVPASLELAGAEIELATLPERELRLRQGLGQLRGGYRYVLIDCPPSLGLLTLNALVAAHEMLIPTQCEYFALEGLSHLLRTHQLIRSRLNPDLRIGGIVMTQFDPRTTLAWDVLEEVRRVYSEYVLHTLIPRNVRISEAPSHGVPVTVHDPNCRGAVAYRQLAEEVLAR